MKYLIFLVFLTSASIIDAQNLRPQSIYASYFGETVTHPGLRVGLNYQLKDWSKTKLMKSGTEKVIQNNMDLSPSIGFFYHKDYQTGLFILPELVYSRKNVKGNYITYGFGAGYMRTFIPNVYDLNSNGEIEKIHTGYNYCITDFSVAFGKDLSVQKNIPMNIYIKPQFLYAFPNYSKGIWYFILELGVSYKLDKK